MKNLGKLTRVSLCLAAVCAPIWAATAHGTGSGGNIPSSPAATAGTVVSDALVTGSGVVAAGNAVTVKLVGLQHDFSGELTITLSYVNASGTVVQSVDLVNRVGLGSGASYGAAADFGNNAGAGDNYYFNSDYAGNLWTAAAALGDADSLPGESTDATNHGQYFSTTTGGTKTNLSYAFAGMDVAAGTWRLTITDAADPNAGSFAGWEIFITTTTAAAGPQAIVAVAGTPQSATVSTTFGAALQAKVTDGAGNPLSGVNVTFSAPASGASATLNGAATFTAATNASGIATSPAPAANATAGSYTVTASVAGVSTPASFALTNTAAAVTSSAVFVKSDATTNGNWKGVYGSDGSMIPNDSAHLPAYATVSFTNALLYTWAPSTADQRALLKYASTTDRIASTYYQNPSFSVDVNFTDGQAHTLALYMDDWDYGGRAQTIAITDAASGTVLNSQSVNGFGANGRYLVWTVKGHVVIKATMSGGQNAVINGIFFDSVSTSTSASASFVTADSTTQGNWKGVYGGDGSLIPNDSTHLPSYATVAFTNTLLYTWAASTSDSRALLKYASTTDRIASTYYNNPAFSIDVNLTDGQAHQVALYVNDWDYGGRAQTINITDAASGILLNSQSVSGFSQSGRYLIWTIKGHVVIQLNMTAGQNAVVNGIFFGGASTATIVSSAVFAKQDTSTQGNWKTVYGTDGSFLPNDSTHSPSYATVTFGNALLYTWAPSTSDARALLKYASTSDRIASTYYNAPGFSLDVNLTDGQSHQLALYLSDWDYGGRAETISISDAASGTLLDSQTASNFASTGRYLVWTVKGHVVLQVITLSGQNAVANGVFFDPVH